MLGGGIAGLTTALELADSGQQVYLVERAERLGGNVARIDLTAPYLDSARDILKDRIARVMRHQNVRVLLQSELLELKGFIGNFKAESRHAGWGSGTGSRVCCGLHRLQGVRRRPDHALRIRHVARRHHLV